MRFVMSTPAKSCRSLPGKSYLPGFTAWLRAPSGRRESWRGGFEAGSLGSLRTNGETGIYGELSTAPADGQAVPVAMKQQVHTGQAQVLTTIHGTTPKLYDIRIDQVRYNDSAPHRNMVIVITDEELLEQTGGIVQGMSGLPDFAGWNARRSRDPRVCQRSDQRLCDFCGKYAQNHGQCRAIPGTAARSGMRMETAVGTRAG